MVRLDQLTRERVEIELHPGNMIQVYSSSSVHCGSPEYIS